MLTQSDKLTVRKIRDKANADEYIDFVVPVKAGATEDISELFLDTKSNNTTTETLGFIKLGLSLKGLNSIPGI